MSYYKVNVISKIKEDINNGVAFVDIAKKYNVPESRVRTIDYGYVFIDVEPHTKNNIRRKNKIEARKSAIVIQNPVKLRTFPITVEMEIQTQEHLDFMVKVLKDKELEIQKRLAKVTLMIDALQRNDYSDLPPSCLEELKVKSDEPRE